MRWGLLKIDFEMKQTSHYSGNVMMLRDTIEA